MGTTTKAAWTAAWTLVQGVATAAVKIADDAEAAVKAAVRRIPYVGAMLVLHGIRAGTLTVRVVPSTVGPVLRVAVAGMPVGKRTLETTCGMDKNSGNKTALFRGAAIGYAFHVAGVKDRMTTDVDAFTAVCDRYDVRTYDDFDAVNTSVKEWLVTAHDAKGVLLPAKGNPARTVGAMTKALDAGRATKANKAAKAEAEADAKAAKRHAATTKANTAKAAAKAANGFADYLSNTTHARMIRDVEAVVTGKRPMAVAFQRMLTDTLTATAVAPVPAKSPKATAAKSAA